MTSEKVGNKQSIWKRPFFFPPKNCITRRKTSLKEEKYGQKLEVPEKGGSFMHMLVINFIQYLPHGGPGRGKEGTASNGSVLK